MRAAINNVRQYEKLRARKEYFWNKVQKIRSAKSSLASIFCPFNFSKTLFRYLSSTSAPIASSTAVTFSLLGTLPLKWTSIQAATYFMITPQIIPKTISSTYNESILMRKTITKNTQFMSLCHKKATRLEAIMRKPQKKLISSYMLY